MSPILVRYNQGCNMLQINNTISVPWGISIMIFYLVKVKLILRACLCSENQTSTQIVRKLLKPNFKWTESHLSKSFPDYFVKRLFLWSRQEQTYFFLILAFHFFLFCNSKQLIKAMVQ